MIIYLNDYFRNWNYVTKHTSNLRNKEVVEYRLKVLEFWKKYGLSPALEYVKDLNPRRRCSRATLYRWRKNLLDSGRLDRMGRYRLSSLDPKSTRPKHCRLPRRYNELYGPIKQILSLHPTLGKNKVYYILKTRIRKSELTLKMLEYLPSISTIGRIIKSMREMHIIDKRGRLSYNASTRKLYSVIRRKKKHKLRRDGYRPKKPGDLIQMDGIISYCYKKRIYILNTVDYVSGKAISTILPSNKAHYTANILI